MQKVQSMTPIGGIRLQKKNWCKTQKTVTPPKGRPLSDSLDVGGDNNSSEYVKA